ncbi:MAG: hypothetical protein KDB80_09130 [Planctomycetes bacterium]|nr:hypothetical protein [Planctomycetota bacterium]
MAISVFDLFSVGIGPSSSHTVGPMRAAVRFLEGLRRRGEFDAVTEVKVELFGSLAATGRGHGSDKAVVLGLEGETPEHVDVDGVEDRLARLQRDGTIRLLGELEIGFRIDRDIAMRRKSLPGHPNGMRFVALADEREGVERG